MRKGMTAAEIEAQITLNNAAMARAQADASADKARAREEHAQANIVKWTAKRDKARELVAKHEARKEDTINKLRDENKELSNALAEVQDAQVTNFETAEVTVDGGNG